MLRKYIWANDLYDKSLLRIINDYLSEYDYRYEKLTSNTTTIHVSTTKVIPLMIIE